MAIEIAGTQQLIIDGKRVPSASEQTYETMNPATGEALAQVAEAGLGCGARSGGSPPGV